MHSLSRKDIGYLGARQSFFSLPGLLVVLLIHGALFYVLWNQKFISPPENLVTLFAEVISPPAPKVEPKVQSEPKPVKLKPVEKPKPPKPKKQRIVSKAPVVKQEYVASPPSVVEPAPEEPAPEPIAAAAPVQMPTGPVMLSSELSVSCPKLTAPTYPSISRRMGEEGKLVLRVELDEDGRVDNARVATSSGYPRLDNAALATVKEWQCQPSMRNGQPIRAVALQPFNFVLQGN